jgi:hypothetical protein
MCYIYLSVLFLNSNILFINFLLKSIVRISITDVMDIESITRNEKLRSVIYVGKHCKYSMTLLDLVYQHDLSKNFLIVHVDEVSPICLNKDLTHVPSIGLKSPVDGTHIL